MSCNQDQDANLAAQEPVTCLRIPVDSVSSHSGAGRPTSQGDVKDSSHALPASGNMASPDSASALGGSPCPASRVAADPAIAADGHQHQQQHCGSGRTPAAPSPTLGRALDRIIISDTNVGEMDILYAAAVRGHPPTQSADHSQRSRDCAVSNPVDVPILASFCKAAVPNGCELQGSIDHTSVDTTGAGTLDVIAPDSSYSGAGRPASHDDAVVNSHVDTCMLIPSVRESSYSGVGRPTSQNDDIISSLASGCTVALALGSQVVTCSYACLCMRFLG